MPTSIEMQGPVKLREITRQKLPVKMEKRGLLKWFPMVTVDETELIYEQRGILKGLQAARGLGGQNGPAKRPGVSQFKVSPGYYGDDYVITEADLVKLREVADWNTIYSYQKHMADASELLMERFLNRVELSCAQIMTTGGFTAGNVATGQQFHQDVYNITQFTPGTLFSDAANSTPLAYFRTVVATMTLGKSVSFKNGALIMSRPTLNLILANTNANDFGGKRLEVGSTINSLEGLNRYLLADDLPPVELCDEDYYADGSTTATRYITNGKIVLIGRRDDNAVIGEYRLTKAAQNENSKPGEWFSTEDRRMYSPPKVTFSMGHNGGPVIYHPEAIAIINAAAAF